ncbi:ribonuclease T2 family protein [Chromobacterium sp. CV08]|uniref:ribonuclease T2 family protein n=1 Tax=Chromobacterium sp. CV08 TaxID=3133274 RepID=UPI003DA9CC42
MLKFLSLCALLFAGAVSAQSLEPARHGDFAHYTYALTWQPGFCATGDGCLPDQPKEELIGLHGLWPSLPQSLIAQKVPVQQWWAKGCAFFPHVNAIPVLPAELRQRLRQTMPQLKDDLLTHEYVKHVQCFGYKAADFFGTALQMREDVVDSDFGRYLLAQAGTVRTREELVEAFAKAFGTDQRRALQLQCGKDARQRNVLTQAWFTIRTDKLDSFPSADSLVDTPAGEYEDNCSEPFLLPKW